jgi:hypothetical protein
LSATGIKKKTAPKGGIERNMNMSNNAKKQGTATPSHQSSEKTAQPRTSFVIDRKAVTVVTNLKGNDAKPPKK